MIVNKYSLLVCEIVKTALQEFLLIAMLRFVFGNKSIALDNTYNERLLRVIIGVVVIVLSLLPGTGTANLIG